jgi:uncharacterized protein YoxC
MRRFDVEDEVRLLQQQGVLLRDRIEGMTEEMRGKTHQLRALAQEVDLYSDAVDKVVKENRKLHIELAARDETIRDLRAQLAAERKATLVPENPGVL